MFPLNSELECDLYRIAHKYIFIQNPKDEYTETLFKAGASAIKPLLIAALDILQENIEGKNEDEAEKFCAPLSRIIPRKIYELTYLIDSQSKNTTVKEVANMLASGRIGALEVLFEACFYQDFKIRILAALVLLEFQKLPTFFQLTRIKEEGFRLINEMNKNPSSGNVSVYNMLVCVYAAILYRGQDPAGPTVLRDERLNLDETEEERRRTDDEFIELTVKELASYTLFSMLFEESSETKY